MNRVDKGRTRPPKPLASDLTRSELEAELPPDLSRLPPKQRAEIISYAVEVAEQHSGPLPHPETLAKYDNVMPGLAERIVIMAESDLSHLQDMQRRVFRAESIDRKIGQIGQIGALAITLAALGTLGWIATSGHPVTGGLLGGATLLGIVSVFIGGREYLLSKIQKTQPPPPMPQRKKR